MACLENLNAFVGKQQIMYKMPQHLHTDLSCVRKKVRNYYYILIHKVKKKIKKSISTEDQKDICATIYL